MDKLIFNNRFILCGKELISNMNNNHALKKKKTTSFQSSNPIARRSNETSTFKLNDEIKSEGNKI